MVLFNNRPINWKAPLFNVIKLWKSGKGFILFNFVVSMVILSLVGNDQLHSPELFQLEKQNQYYQNRLSSLEKEIEGMNSKLAVIVGRDDSLYRVVYEASPIPIEQRLVGYGGADRYENLLGYENSDNIINVATKLDQLARQLYVEHKSLVEVANKADYIAEKMASVPAILPVKTEDFRYISSPFGYRNHPKNGHWKRHEGVDIVAPYGAPVYATGKGVVEFNRPSLRGYGKVIIVDHGYGFKTLYAHLSKKVIQPSDSVNRGQLLGYVGNTGISTGTHLHYEVIRRGNQVNPSKYFSNDLSSWDYQAITRAAMK